MSDDRTVAFSALFPLTVRIEKGIAQERQRQFTSTFQIGRGPDCDVRLLDRSVSKHHVQIRFEGREWWAQDLHSRNGTFLNGTRIEQEPLPQETRLELGHGGPVLLLTMESLVEQPEQEEAVPPEAPATGSPSGDELVSQDSDVASAKEEGRLPEPIDDLERRLLEAEHAAKEAEHRRLAGEVPPSAESVPPPPKAPGPVLGESHGKGVVPPVTPPSSAPVPSPVILPESKSSQLEQISSRGSFTEVIRRSLETSPSGGAGQQTIMIGRAVRKVLKTHSHKYLVIIGIVAALSVILGGVAWYQQVRITNLKAMASGLFYSMKERELELAQLEDLVLEHLSPRQIQDFLKRQEQLRRLQKEANQEYERFLEEIGIYTPDMTQHDRLILRMTRLFGESEVEMPDGFVEEVKDYIRKWQSTDRLTKAIRLAQRRGYGPKIAEAMLAEHMPPQFFYVGLQESGFNREAVGPKTRFGIAKGPWQFIPATAVQYGLRPGPLVNVERYDPRDERHNFQKATRAAAKYLRFLYNTDAQASGLLVMASYNWGPTRVKSLIRKLPENPKDRNFWQLLKQFKVPKQTRDYVFYIFSAAVIGEDPRSFGFDFDNPLKQTRTSGARPSL